MNKNSKNKLAHIFGLKYFELIGSATQHPFFYSNMHFTLTSSTPPMFSKWMKYLEEIECRIVPKDAKMKRGFVRVEDPCHHHNKIEIPKEFAHKVLVLGGLP
jgi:hypothetical protein